MPTEVLVALIGLSGVVITVGATVLVAWLTWKSNQEGKGRRGKRR